MPCEVHLGQGAVCDLLLAPRAGVIASEAKVILQLVQRQNQDRYLGFSIPFFTQFERHWREFILNTPDNLGKLPILAFCLTLNRSVCCYFMSQLLSKSSNEKIASMQGLALQTKSLV